MCLRACACASVSHLFLCGCCVSGTVTEKQNPDDVRAAATAEEAEREKMFGVVKQAMYIDGWSWQSAPKSALFTFVFFDKRFQARASSCVVGWSKFEGRPAFQAWGEAHGYRPEAQHHGPGQQPRRIFRECNQGGCYCHERMKLLLQQQKHQEEKEGQQEQRGSCFTSAGVAVTTLLQPNFQSTITNDDGNSSQSDSSSSSSSSSSGTVDVSEAKSNSGNSGGKPKVKGNSSKGSRNISHIAKTNTDKTGTKRKSTSAIDALELEAGSLQAAPKRGSEYRGVVASKSADTNARWVLLLVLFVLLVLLVLLLLVVVPGCW